MSYIIEVTVPALPAADALRMSQENGAGRHPALVRLHDVLTAVCPCMSRYPDGDPPLGECPWSDGPLIGNVGSRMAVLGLNGGGQLAVATRFVTDAATMLGLTALDQQAGRIYRPDPERRAATYFVTVNGVSRGARKEPVAARLAHAFGRDPVQVRAMLDRPVAIVRTGLDRIGAPQYRHALLKFGCNSSMGPEIAGLPILMKGGNRPVVLERPRAAAGQGVAQAQMGLGFLYLLGIDGPQDSAQATRWFELAARQGDPTAQVAMASP
jgi:hypothetical protein